MDNVVVWFTDKDLLFVLFPFSDSPSSYLQLFAFALSIDTFSIKTTVLFSHKPAVLIRLIFLD